MIKNRYQEIADIHVQMRGHAGPFRFSAADDWYSWGYFQGRLSEQMKNREDFTSLQIDELWEAYTLGYADGLGDRE